MKRIAVIRIAGQVGLHRDVDETLYRLKIRRKYACVVLENPSKEQMGMIERVRDFVSFGEIDEATYKELKEKRSTKIENFFRLHPPRKGIETKKHAGVGKGVLGKNEKINELIKRML